jgi:hypothetical protein
MANSLTASNPEFWSKRMQVVRIDETVFEAIANMEERAVLKKGDTVHRPYRSALLVDDYTKGTDVTLTDISSTDEYLTVEESKIVPFYVDEIDETQNGYDTAAEFADDAGRKLYSYIDGEFLAEVINASQDLDDGDIGGTAGNSIQISAANVVKVFTNSKKLLKRQNANMSNLVAVVSPSFMAALLERVEGKDSAFGDSTSKNGHIGSYMKFDLYESNNLPLTGRWTPANNPSNNDTITIDGVTFTFVSSIGSTEGNVLIGANTAATLDNIVALITAPKTTTANGVAFTTVSKLEKVLRMTATDGTTYFDLSYSGGSEATLAASEAADVWSRVIVHQYFGEAGAVDMVIQTMPNVHFKDDPDRLGKNVFTHTLYGKKTFTEGANVMVDVKVDASVL